MIFKLNLQEDSWLEKVYEEAMADLNQFFGINWIENRPQIYILPDRKAFDTIRGTKTPRWLVGFGGRRMNGVYLLDRANFEKESDNKYSEEIYAALLKHELCHCFIDILTKSYRKPVWLMEGLSVYLSGQLNQYQKPEKFENFLNSVDKQGEKVYSESGFAIKTIVEKYGKGKMIELLKLLPNHPDETNFGTYFKNIYGIDLNYEVFM